MEPKMRVGIGYDIHPLIDNRRLVLGGVKIPFKKGLEGWSDADVVIHAAIDALLGAAALGDIGSHFPTGDAKYKDISSLELLIRVKDEMGRLGWSIINIDVTIVAEQPNLRDYIDSMRQQIGMALEIQISQVSVKASTNNRVGSLGRNDGIASYVVALIEERSENINQVNISS
jgi:2-C-methyl-D-erythritol 2,4-cyclodiphosphate synthase